MGTGAGATTIVDGRPSPQRSAIEKAQAELRHEVAVREQRRRELEFLERGGNPLDFVFVEESLLAINAYPLSEQSLASEGVATNRSTSNERADTYVNCHDNTTEVDSSRLLVSDGKANSVSANKSNAPVVLGAEEEENFSYNGSLDKKAQPQTTRSKEIKDQFGNGHTCANPLGEGLPMLRTSAPLPHPHTANVCENRMDARADESMHSLPSACDARILVDQNTVINNDAALSVHFPKDKQPNSHILPVMDLSAAVSNRIETIEESVCTNNRNESEQEKTYLENNGKPSDDSCSQSVNECHADVDNSLNICKARCSSTMPSVKILAKLDNSSLQCNLQPGVPTVTDVDRDNSPFLNVKVEDCTIKLSGNHVSPTPDINGVDGKKCRTTLSAVAIKAHEDMILEEAESIKNSHKVTAELARCGPAHEPTQLKSHWDFVLEEMAWLANDFMQERLWKIAAAAQVSRWIFQERHERKFAAKELKQRRKRISQALASSVKNYWKSARSLICKVKLEEPRAEDGDTSATPMDIDLPPIETLVKDRGDNEMFPLMKYAFKFLGDTAKVEILGQVKPLLPDRPCIYEDFLSDHFPEESLFYILHEGAFASCRLLTEENWASFVAKNEQHIQDQASAIIQAETSDFFPISDIGITGFGEEVKPFVEMQMVDEAHPQDMPDGVYGGLSNSLIAKRKRKNIFKTNAPRYYEEIGEETSHVTDQRLSYLPGTRPISGGTSASNMVSIPIKRMRTSAAGRQRPAGTAMSNVFSSVGMSSTNGIHRSSAETVKRTPFMSGGGLYSKTKKKKKHFTAGFIQANTPSKIPGREPSMQQEGNRQAEQKEHAKRKSEQAQVSSSSDGALGGSDTPGTPGSQGQPSKKLKLSKQQLETNTESFGVDSCGTPLDTPAQSANFLGSKIMRQQSNRERTRKTKVSLLQTPNQPGVGIPWSTVEDQAILALVHDLGANWELVSDVLSSNSQFKGIFRKPKDCKERHKFLLERLSTDNNENSEDLNTSQSHPSGLSGLPKGSARYLLQRLQGPLEEDTLKVHLEAIVCVMQQHQSKQQNVQNISQESLEMLPTHASHLCALPTTLINSPLDLCEPPLSNGDVAYPLQASHGNGLVPGVLGSGSTPGMPLLPNFHAGANISTSPSISAAAARDAQRMAASMRPLSAEEQRLRYTRMLAGRNMQPQGNLDPGGLSLTSVSNAAECGMPMMNAGNTGGLMGGFCRGVSLARPGLQSIVPPGVPGMPSGANMMLPPGSIASTAVVAMPGMKRCKEVIQLLRSGRCSEDQKQLLVQELQHLAAQGSPQAIQGLNSLNINIPSGSSSQNFTVQPQHLSPHKQKQQQSINQNQAYMAVVRNQMQQQKYQQQPAQQQHQQQEQSVQQQQQHKRLFRPSQEQQPQLPSGSIPLQLQQSLPSNSQHQNLGQVQLQQLPITSELPPQDHSMSSLPAHQTVQSSQQQAVVVQSQQQHQASSNCSQQTKPPQKHQVSQQVQSPPALAQQQVTCQLQPPHQVNTFQPQSVIQSQMQQQAQHSQQMTKSGKGIGRGIAQGHATQPNVVLRHEGGQFTGQLQNQPTSHLASGHRMFSTQGPYQTGKPFLPTAQQTVPGQSIQLQAQNQSQTQVQVQAANVSQVVPTQKGSVKQQHQSSQQQQEQQQCSASPSTPPSQPQSPPSSQQQPIQQVPTLPVPSIQRRQATQPPPHRKLQQRQTGSINSVQQQSQPSLHSQIAHQHGALPYLANMNIGIPNGLPLSSAIGSSAPWRPSQKFSAMSGGMYNLTRNSSGVTNQVSVLSAATGTMLAVSNSSNGASLSTSGLPHSNTIGLPQQAPLMQAGPGLHCQKTGLSSAGNKVSVPQIPARPLGSSASTVSTVSTSTIHTKSPGGSPGAIGSLSLQGVTMPSLGSSMPTSPPMLMYGAQGRQMLATSPIAGTVQHGTIPASCDPISGTVGLPGNNSTFTAVTSPASPQ